MNSQKNDSISLWMFLTSMLIFGTIGIFRRFIPLPSASLAFFRGAVGALFLIAFVKIRGGRIRHGIGMRKVIWLFITGSLIGFNWIFLFEAYNHTTVAVATLCYYMQPTIVILLSPFLFRERLTAKKGICAVVAVIGMVFISGIVEGGILQFSQAKGILFGLAAASLYAIVVILNKKIPALILSACFLHETMSIYGMIGAVMILGAAFISEF